MDDHEITWYMQEISMNGFGAGLHFNAFKEAIDDSDLRQTRIVWFHLTAFLSHAAMISKFLSPIDPRGIKKERMDILREKLDVSEDSEVLPRDARDNAEHFDERIDNWVGNDTQGILEIVLDNRDGYEFLNAENKHIKRLIIQDELIFVSEKRNGEKLELPLNPVASEINRVTEAADRWLKVESPYHFILPQQYT